MCASIFKLKQKKDKKKTIEMKNEKNLTIIFKIKGM